MVLTGDYPRCPVCGNKFDDLGVLEEGHNDITCDDCGADYTCLVTTSTDYETEEVG